MLDVESVSSALPFTLCNAYGDELGLIFERNSATTAAIRAAMERLALRQGIGEHGVAATDVLDPTSDLSKQAGRLANEVKAFVADMRAA